jgi:branched-chain amino acid transport system ATP-binding protein
MDFLGLAALQQQAAGNLPLGLQKRLELGRALGLAPKLLLLDEPAAGLNTSETQELAHYCAASATTSSSRSCWSNMTWAW